METSLPTPTTARVYVNLPEGIVNCVFSSPPGAKKKRPQKRGAPRSVVAAAAKFRGSALKEGLAIWRFQCRMTRFVKVIVVSNELSG